MRSIKKSTSFVCQECGYDSPAFLGKCPECGVWGSMKEISIRSASWRMADEILNKTNKPLEKVSPITLDEIKLSDTVRLKTAFSEFDTVVGGGIVPGSVTILAGDPGIGKSTLLLQLGLSLALEKKKVFYITGEESTEQVKLRASRITNGKKKDSFEHFLLVSHTNTDALAAIMQEVKPILVIVDSIQTMESEHVGGLAGSIPQVRYAALSFIRVAKTLGIPIFLIGHVTKEGMVAGPMTLSHMVDTVLFLEGEKGLNTRILRSFKNRFGPIDEVGIFTMEEKGMSQLKSADYLFFDKDGQSTPGSVAVAILEGTRTFIVEIQALVVFSKLPFPRRVASGIDGRRLELLLAVLQKHCNVPIHTMDVFVNVAGGLRISDPSSDLGVCLSLYSSLKNKALPKTIAISEVGLLGELRSVPMLEKRIKEAKKLGFTKIFSMKSHRFLADLMRTV